MPQSIIAILNRHLLNYLTGKLHKSVGKTSYQSSQNVHEWIKSKFCILFQVYTVLCE